MGRRKEIEPHLTPEEIDEAVERAQQNDDARLVRRLLCLKNLYAGDTLAEAGDRVGVDAGTVSRWSDDWNDEGLTGLRPDFGGGRPSKLSGTERARLEAVLERHRPWTTSEIQLLIEEAFDVRYSNRHISRLCESFDASVAVSRERNPDRPDATEAELDDRLSRALADLEDDDVVTDGSGCSSVDRSPDE